MATLPKIANFPRILGMIFFPKVCLQQKCTRNIRVLLRLDPPTLTFPHYGNDDLPDSYAETQEANFTMQTSKAKRRMFSVQLVATVFWTFPNQVKDSETTYVQKKHVFYAFLKGLSR